LTIERTEENQKTNENDRFIFTKSRSRIAGRLEHKVIFERKRFNGADFSIIGESKEIVFLMLVVLHAVRFLDSSPPPPRSRKALFFFFFPRVSLLMNFDAC
jgi:hypothetical protein